MGYNFKNRRKPGDWPYDCNICGFTAWASDTTVLAPETGRGGYRVCPECVDSIDYGIIPYTIRAEQALPFAQSLLPPATFPVPPIDPPDGLTYEEWDPASGVSPFAFQVIGENTNVVGTSTIIIGNT